MLQAEIDELEERGRLENKFRLEEAKRRYEEELREGTMQHVIASVPFVPQGRKIVPDSKVLKRLPELIAEVASHRSTPEWREQLAKDLLEQFNAAAGDIPFDASELESDAAQAKRTLVMMTPYTQGALGGVEGKIQMIRQWLCICHALVQAGANVITISPPDAANFFERRKEIFTRDRYAMVGDTAYFPDTQEAAGPDIGEALIPQMEKELQARGVKTVTVKGAWFAGGNVTRHYSTRTIFFGTDENSSFGESAQKLLSAINATQKDKWNLVTVPLTNKPDMYHLDCGMSDELPHGEVMISPRVTDERTYRIICEIVGKENIIELTDEEAKALATNTVGVADTLVMTGTCDSLRRKLVEEKKYNVVMPDNYGQPTFAAGRGGNRCMSNELPQPHRKLRSSCVL